MISEAISLELKERQVSARIEIPRSRIRPSECVMTLGATSRKVGRGMCCAPKFRQASRTASKQLIETLGCEEGRARSGRGIVSHGTQQPSAQPPSPSWP